MMKSTRDCGAARSKLSSGESKFHFNIFSDQGRLKRFPNLSAMLRRQRTKFEIGAKSLLSIALMASFSIGASAQELVYEPVNPSFGGNSFNSAHLLAIANAQNDYERPETESSTSSDLDRFIRSLQSRLLSSLSTQVANAIFGEDAQDEGTITFGDQTVSFVRTLEGIELTITEGDGSVTVITIPTFQSSDSTDSDSSSSSTANTGLSSKSNNLGAISNAEGGLSYSTNLNEATLQPIQQPIQ